MNKLEVGSYVKYKGTYYIAAEVTASMVKILDVKSSNKLAVLISNVQVAPWVCHKILSGNDKYLVTLKDRIIVSLVSNRVMQWDLGHGKAKEILAHIV